jgi:hypothetical protein
MPSNRPEPRRRRPALVALALTGALLVGGAIAAGPMAGPASAATASSASGSSSSQSDTTIPALESCAPGHIVRLPNCGREPQSPTDPGGWLQVSLFFLICGVILALMAFVWWRSRLARREREAAGTDPVTRARASGQGVRRNTRNEPVAETSSKVPESNAGR